MASPPRSGQHLWVRRLGWLVLIWMLSVIALGVVAALLRVLMKVVGLTA